MNHEFLTGIFGPMAYWAHVTAFTDDPSDIAQDRRGICWAGRHYGNAPLEPGNQYFTISLFAPDNGRAVRRKANFSATHVIVADDVNEKLPVERVSQLPPPSYKLFTSAGSEQWGWILAQPEQSRERVDNLLDGLVKLGLAPDGRDPGMRGVTRYVRLPDGYNSKASRLVNGEPFKCHLSEWKPERRYTMGELAGPFGVDLYAKRDETAHGGLAYTEDHPILDYVDVLGVRGGTVDIVCPWVETHTDQDTSGTAIFLKDSLSIGFKCHHGHCEHLTGKDLLDLVENREPRFRERLDKWKIIRKFGIKKDLPEIGEQSGEDATPPIYSPLAVFQHTPPGEALPMAYELLKHAEGLPHAETLTIWNAVKDHMGWNAQDLKTILNEQRSIWYPKIVDDSIFANWVYVAEQHFFYNTRKRMALKQEAFRFMFGHVDEEIIQNAIYEGKIQKVDKLNYWPEQDQFYEEDGISFLNSWAPWDLRNKPGSIAEWWNHFDRMGWAENRDHIIKWMAFTLRHPSVKINHALLLAGDGGNGKDFLLYPLMMALGADAQAINGEVILEGFQEFLLGTKLLLLNEVSLANASEAKNVTDKLKPLAAAPPTHLRANIKGVSPARVKNIVNLIVTSNSVQPIHFHGESSRRFYALWSEYSIYDQDENVKPAEAAYWDHNWKWIRDCEGWRCVIDFLLSVDLSDFNPGAVPPKTDFLRDIEDVSRDGVGVVIRDLVAGRHGPMAKDIVTIKDVQNALKLASMFGFHVDKVPPVTTLGKIVRQARIGAGVRTKSGRYFIIRNHEKYVGKTAAEIEVIYAS